MGPVELGVVLAGTPHPHTHTPAVCRDLNLVNTLKSYYDHISRAAYPAGKHSLFVVKQ